MSTLKKVLLTLALILTLVFALTACNNGGGGGGGDNTPEDPDPPAHVHAFDQRNPTTAYLKSNATCTEAAVYYYSCTCGEKGSETFADGSATPHTYNRQNTSATYLKSEATEQSPAVYYYSCVCGDKGTETFLYGDALVNNLTLTYAPTSDYSFYVVTGVTGRGSTLEIPAIYDGLRVVAIAENAFKDNTTLTKVILPNTIEEIGANAFRGCTALAEINLPEESVASIGAYVFADCTALTTIRIPSKVTTLSEGVFQGCTRLQNVTLVDGLRSIGNLSFDGCTALGTITLPNTVTSLGNMAFRHAEALTSVEFSSGLTAIGNATFQYCKSLSSVELHSKITVLGNSAFSYCYGLKELRILGGIISWGNSTFYECTALESVYIEHSSAASVPAQNYIFYNAGTEGAGIAFAYKCNITLPNLLLTPNDDKNLPKVASRTAVHNYATEWTAIDDAYHGYKCQNSGCTSAPGKTTHTFGDWVVDKEATCVATGIRHHVCTTCNKSVSETIPVNNTAHNYATTWTIDGTHHWHKCQNSGCTSVLDKAPHTWDKENTCTACQRYKDDGVKFTKLSDGTYMVSDYTGSATEVIIPSVYNGCAVTSIGGDAFYNCSKITSVTIPDSVTSIGAGAFSGCSNLKYNEYGNAYYLGNSTNPYVYLADVKNTSITSVTILDGVKFIGPSAFQYCSGLTSVTIPDSVTSIGSSAFSGCKSLTSVTIPDSVTSIGKSAFSGCSGLTSITLPFVGTRKDGTSNTHFGYIFGASSYSDNDYYVPSSLKTVVITGGTSIGDDAFWGCSRLTSVTIGKSVTSIGESAFYRCYGLTSITIPDSVTSIGDGAFDYCYELENIHFGGTKAQWNSISKGLFWKYGTITVYCTDGNITEW